MFKTYHPIIHSHEVPVSKGIVQLVVLKKVFKILTFSILRNLSLATSSDTMQAKLTPHTSKILGPDLSSVENWVQKHQGPRLLTNQDPTCEFKTKIRIWNKCYFKTLFIRIIKFKSWNVKKMLCWGSHQVVVHLYMLFYPCIFENHWGWKLE